MRGWRLGVRLVSFIATGGAALLLYIPGLVLGFVTAIAAMLVFDLSGEQGGDIVEVVWNVPAGLFLVVGLATWAPAAWTARVDRRKPLEPVDPGPLAEALEPLANEVRVAGFRDVGWFWRGRRPFLALVSGDGIVAVVMTSPAGMRGSRAAADGTPALIALSSPIVVGREVAQLATLHGTALGRRHAMGPAVAQVVPSGDPVVMVAHHRTAAAYVSSVGLPVMPVEPAAVPFEIDRLNRQAAHGVVVGLTVWLVARHRWRHPETVTASTRPKVFARDLQSIVSLLPWREQKLARAAIRGRATAGRPAPRPPVVLPDRPPTGPPETWPGR